MLGGAEYALFHSMERRDQRHGLEVMRRLRFGGETDRELLTAALLHDCGKGAVPAFAYVVTPALVRRLGSEAAGAPR
jgi:hypothetical protein